MVVTEKITLNGTEYIRNYSDCGFCIERDGVVYSEAIDPLGTDRVYTETNVPIESDSEEATEADYQNALAEMGVNLNE
jgi:hypothetical protein